MRVVQGVQALDARVESLVESAVRIRGVPEALAGQAGESTRRNVRVSHGEPAWSIRTRARSYFDATVRRMVARSCDPDVVRYRTGVIADALADDLRSAGVNEGRIAREVSEWLACVSA